MAAIAAVNPLDRISQDFNILQSTDFNRQVVPDTLSEPPKMTDSVNQNLKKFLQP